MPHRSLPPVPLSFTAKKIAILASLAVPDTNYTDASPKGSVDVAIKPLIDRINAMDGVVTTSSCAGRMSVFLEGTKERSSGSGVDKDGNALKRIGNEVEMGDVELEGMGGTRNIFRQNAVPGGKGNGGRWLFVTHEPVKRTREDAGIAEMLGLSLKQSKPSRIERQEIQSMRFIRFQFEPMILHIMTASLHHAQPILSAAINSGFRESGVQSLKNLDDTTAYPMVAVRTSGLAFETLIGYIDVAVRSDVRLTSLVSEEYLNVVFDIANERFKLNVERMKRFEDGLLGRDKQFPNWEDTDSRKSRKKAEGLARQAATQSYQTDRDNECGSDEDDAVLVALGNGPV